MVVAVAVARSNLEISYTTRIMLPIIILLLLQKQAVIRITTLCKHAYYSFQIPTYMFHSS